jgi:hypothetical protein
MDITLENQFNLYDHAYRSSKLALLSCKILNAIMYMNPSLKYVGNKYNLFHRLFVFETVFNNFMTFIN